ncbi:MAG: hypothetical protein PSN34_01680 [Urechidicola sp.]|nr:hypothetical protein [Urechidicola sp.]
MNIHAEKIELTKLLLNTDNPTIIQSIKDIFKKAKSSDFWDSLSFEQQKEIKEASLEIEKGETTDYEEFMSKHR